MNSMTHTHYETLSSVCEKKGGGSKMSYDGL